MFEAVVTFVTLDNALDEDNMPLVITKVYRVEFQNEVDFQAWLKSAEAQHSAVDSAQFGSN